ncbi:DNA-binding transcriptional regulator, FadR family [Flavobacteriaceae bacterium MAR_2010_188]|nr:DNA-binding transcriptional regulator, FadR family [Flavobacteriaceae bacterium MAR_2010_188]
MKSQAENFKPILKESMVDQVERNLWLYFKNNDFHPGDNLPTEKELAENMNVSRNVIREALSRFRMLGLISSNKKSGIQLEKFDLFSALARVMDPDVLDKSTLHNLFELRIMLEIGMADAIYRNINKDEIKFLRQIVEDYELRKNVPDKIEHEISFHSALYKISKNETLCGFQKYLRSVFDYVLELESVIIDENKANTKVSHNELIDCLEKGSAEEFRKLMHDHFNPYYEMNFLE